MKYNGLLLFLKKMAKFEIVLVALYGLKDFFDCFRFATLRATCDSLPAEPPRYYDFSFLNRPDSGASSGGVSRCSTRSRIKDAQAYAASTDFD